MTSTNSEYSLDKGNLMFAVTTDMGVTREIKIGAGMSALTKPAQKYDKQSHNWQSLVFHKSCIKSKYNFIYFPSYFLIYFTILILTLT